MVPGAGLEPARSCLRGILSPLCLPIPPPGLEKKNKLYINSIDYLKNKDYFSINFPGFNIPFLSKCFLRF